MAARWCAVVLVACATPFAVPQQTPQSPTAGAQLTGEKPVAQPSVPPVLPPIRRQDGNLIGPPLPEVPPTASVPESDVNPSTPPPISLGTLTRFQGLRVSDVELKSTVQFHPDVLQQMMEQKEGEPFDKNKIRRTIQALYETGRFSDVEAQAQSKPNHEISLVFMGRENYFVGFIGVDGVQKNPTPDELATAAKIQLGELFTPDKVQRGMERMKQLMEENGYYVHFHVTPGPLARIGNITVQGTPGYSIAEIKSIAHFHPGDHVSRAGVTKALQRLRKRYQKNRRLEAQVSIIDRVYHPETSLVDYVFKIERGPTVDVRVEGASLSSGKLKRFVPVYEENAVDEDLLNEGARNISDYFQNKGYFDVDVASKRQLSSQGDHMDVTYQVTLGEKHKLTEVAISGNRYFPDDLIKDRLLVQPSAPLVPHGRYSQSAVERDKQSIEALYRDNGFQQVNATSDVQDDYKGERGRMRVQYNIVEGRQTLVDHLEVTGATTFETARLVNLVNAADGQPFSDQTLSTDRDSLTSFYFNRGFPEVRVEAEIKDVAGQPDLRDVVYNVTEGERQYVDNVLLSGTHFTKPFVIRREFQLWDGDPLSQARELETQRRIYDLGIFN